MKPSEALDLAGIIALFVAAFWLFLRVAGNIEVTLPERWLA